MSFLCVIEGRRQDELAAEPAGGCCPRGRDPLHRLRDRGAHRWGAVGKSTIYGSAAYGNTAPDGNPAPDSDRDPYATDADAPAGAADTDSRSRGRRRR